MATSLFEEIFSADRIERSYKQATRGKHKFVPEALIFSLDETVNLNTLRKSLFDGTYEFSGYYRFIVREPKERIIHAPFLADKIVQLCLNERLSELYLPKFIPETYGCLKYRGTHRAVDKVQRNLQAAYERWGAGAYILKVDVRKFFYSIDRSILKRIYRKEIKEQDVLVVLDEIVDSANAIGEVGLPLGNTMSQLLANVYMDRLDQTCKRYWGYKYYVRYVDDVIIVLPNKEVAQQAKEKCTMFLKKSLNLDINFKKTQIFPLDQGVNCFGYKVWRTHRLLRNDSKSKIKRKIKAFPKLIEEGAMTLSKADEMLASWTGHSKHANSHKFIESLSGRWPYIYVDKKGVLRIDPEKIK